MATFSWLQSEIKRGAIRDQSGSTFTGGIKNVINRSIHRISREANWKPLRRKTTFDTVTSVTADNGSATNGSTTITRGAGSWITDGAAPGKRFTIGDSNTVYTIDNVASAGTMTLTANFDGTTSAGDDLTWVIYAQGEYNAPIQAGYNLFLWHEQYGATNPYLMNYVTDQSFYGSGVNHLSESIPTHYKMWGEDMVIAQPLAASTITIVSSSASDTNKEITIFGTVSGYPDYEVITTDSSDGTTGVTGSKSFTTVERVVRADSTSGSTIGRITVSGGNSTIAVLPVGETTSGIQYKKIQLYPLPNAVFSMNVQYYKQPYKLVNDNDVHELGEDFDQAIIFLSIAILKYENNQDEGDKFTALYQNEIKNLRKTNIDKIDWLPRMQRPREDRANQPRIGRFLAYGQVGTGGFFGPKAF